MSTALPIRVKLKKLAICCVLKGFCAPELFKRTQY
jgi:hypothetical protein